LVLMLLLLVLLLVVGTRLGVVLPTLAVSVAVPLDGEIVLGPRSLWGMFARLGSVGKVE